MHHLMESPPSPPPCHLAHVSYSQSRSPLQCPSDSVDESPACSADPNAFLGFHVPSIAHDMNRRPSYDSPEQQHHHTKDTHTLVLDLEMETDDNTSASDGVRPVRDSSRVDVFSDFKISTRHMQETHLGVKGGNLKHGDTTKTLATSRPSILKSMNSAWNARKQQKIADEAEKKQREKNESDELIPAFCEDSQEGTPRLFPTAYTSSASWSDESVHEGDQKRLMSEGKGKVDRNGTFEDSDRDTDYEDEMECTQQLIEEDTCADETCHFKGRDDEETEVYPFFENVTLPYRADSVLEEDVKSRETSNERKNAASVSYSREPSVVVPTLGRTTDQRNGEDEVTSREGSQATQQDYLTPRVKPNRLRQSDPANGESVTVVDPKGNVEQILKTSQNDDDQAECVLTYPSKHQAENESLVEADSRKQNVKKSDENFARKDVTGTDSQTKGIRSLEFSFVIPESQEGESHSSASLYGNGTPVARRLEAFTGSSKPSPYESSISPVVPSSMSTQPSEDNFAVPEVAIDNHASPKRKKCVVSSLPSDLPSGKKKPKTVSPATTFPCPIARKRNSGVFSPDSNASSNQPKESNPQTPRCSVRRNSRSAQSTPSSTPTVRTRIRTITPVPSQRTYVSRSRSLFKYKFEFCLTGFVKTGERNLKELIEGHGGKIPERYQDVLYKTNPKAVVIATPVSWRKRKFMQAVACGIPVVHTDWIKNCIEAGHVIPFDGYQVPIGYSITTRKFECFSPKALHIFEGYSFGIASDVAQMSKSEAKDKAKLMAFMLKACGAEAVYENLSVRDSIDVDVVLCEEYTPACRYYKQIRHVPVKDFQWVTECMVLQQFLDPVEPIFEPLRVDSEDVFAASAEIGDSDNTTLKLYKGELVMAENAGSVADHYLLFNVYEILSIHVSGHKDECSQSKRKDCNESRVMLRVGMLKREPYNPELSKPFVKVLDISSFQVKRRVVAISKKHYSQLKYKDESIFYLEDEPSMSLCRNTSG